MGFGSYVADGARMVLLRKEAIRSVISDDASRSHAFSLVGVYVFLLTVLGVMVMRSIPFPLSASQVVVSVLLSVIAFSLLFLTCFGVFYGFSKLLGSSISFSKFIGAMMASSIAYVVVILVGSLFDFIPVIGIFFSVAALIFVIVLSVFVIKETCSLSLFRAIFVWLLSVTTLLVAFVCLVAVALGPEGLTAIRQGFVA